MVKKELEEESGVTNLKLLENGIFGLSIQIVKLHTKKEKYVSSHLHYDLQFLFEASENEKLKIDPNENSNVGWIDISSLLDKVNEDYTKPLYQKLIDKVKRLNI